jgi:hypothetical protein
LGLQWSQTISRTIADGVLANNSTLTSATANFTSADKGSTVTDPTAIGGTGNLSGSPTIVSIVSPTQAQISVPGGTAPADHVMISRSVGALVTYWSDPASTTGPKSYDLVRDFCKAGQNVTFPPTSSILAHDLPANQGPATITCGPNISANMCTPSYLAANWLHLTPFQGANGNDGVASVNLSITEPLSAYQYNLSATPRYLNPGGSGVPSGGTPIPSLLLLGSGSQVFTAQNSTVNVSGQIGFNSYNSDDVDLSSSATLTDTNPLNITSPFAVYQCPSSCNPASITNNPSAYAGPSPTSVSSQFSTPSVPIPSQPAPTDPVGTCNRAVPFPKNSNVTCTPGVYPSGINLSKSGISLTFQPGNYLFEGPVEETSSTGNDSISFGSGQYTFNNTFDSSGIALSTAGSTGTAGINDSVSGNGVFFYIQSGQVNLAGPKNSIQLSPATSGAYAGVVLYQASTDASTVALAASTNSVDSLSGALEAPAAAVSITASTNTFSLGFVVAKSMSVVSSGSVKILG